jgi:ABC-type transport system involved in cytochrome bd biosynthesis fused ATPase/permease subunit
MYFNENRKNRLTTEEAAETLLKEVVDMENYYKRLMGEVFYSILTAVLIAGKE